MSKPSYEDIEAELNQLRGILCEKPTDDVVICARQLVKDKERYRLGLEVVEKSLEKMIGRF